MKSIVRLKSSLLISVCSTCFLPLCLMEPFFSSKANITPVKLFHISQPWNSSSSSSIRKDDSAFGSRAKISRVVPIKHSQNLRQANMRNASNPVFKFGNYSNSAKKNPSMRMGNVPLIQVGFKSPEKKKSIDTEKSTFSSRVSSKTSITTTTTTLLPPSTNKSPNRNPLFLTSDSWSYLNSAVTDSELRQIINGFSNEVIKNISDISKRDPLAGQNLLLQSIISEVGNLKRSRMLALDSEKRILPVNKGVRFSAKQRKPVLNVAPLEQKIKLGKPVKNLIKTGVVEQWNISGLISNGEADKKQLRFNTLNGSMKKNLEVENYPNASITPFKASPIYPGSTTPTLMQVLSVPEQLTFVSTTFSPSIPNESKDGFVPSPSIPMNSIASSNAKPFMYGEQAIPNIDDSIEKSKRILEQEIPTTTSRKPRVPPKEDEYLLPPITSTLASTPDEGNKGYQTISESTTEGPKVIWYHHNQTPQDTFYPNSDSFLVPPEESSIEILTDLTPLQPIDDENSLTAEAFHSPSSSEISFKQNNRIGNKGKGKKKGRPVLHYTSNEVDDDDGDDDIKTRSKGSRTPVEKGNKKRNKIVPLQASATDHDEIPDNYEDLDNKNGDGSRDILYHDHNKKIRYGPPASYNGYSNDFKHHEIVPQHQKTNRKPPPYKEDDTKSYGAFNQANHYHNSYPAPPAFTRHEIGLERYRNYHDSKGDYEKEEGIQTYDSGNGFKDEGPTTESDVYFKKEPSYRPKESSPGYDPYNGGQFHGHGHGHNDNHGHGWKDPSKDFFSKAKDYLKSSDLNTAEKWFDVSIGVLAFLAFGGYIIMLLYQVFSVSSGTSIGTMLGRSVKGAGEMFDLFFSKGPIGQAYLDELETIVKRAMANVKRIWMTNSFAEKSIRKLKGETDAK